MINKIYYSFLSKCKLSMYESEQIQMQSFDLFENEWVQYNKMSKTFMDNVTKDPYILLPINLSDEIQSKLYV